MLLNVIVRSDDEGGRDFRCTQQTSHTSLYPSCVLFGLSMHCRVSNVVAKKKEELLHSKAQGSLNFILNIDFLQSRIEGKKEQKKNDYTFRIKKKKENVVKGNLLDFVGRFLLLLAMRLYGNIDLKSFRCVER